MTEEAKATRKREPSEWVVLSLVTLSPDKEPKWDEIGRVTALSAKNAIAGVDAETGDTLVAISERHWKPYKLEVPETPQAKLTPA